MFLVDDHRPLLWALMAVEDPKLRGLPVDKTKVRLAAAVPNGT